MDNRVNDLKNLFQDIGAQSCPYIFNLHCHTTSSDGSLEPLQLYSQASSLGLKHLAITDQYIKFSLYTGSMV